MNFEELSTEVARYLAPGECVPEAVVDRWVHVGSWAVTGSLSTSRSFACALLGRFDGVRMDGKLQPAHGLAGLVIGDRRGRATIKSQKATMIGLRVRTEGAIATDLMSALMEYVRGQETSDPPPLRSMV
jgi:hypothetical protein